ncbi:hypothetical protein T484DRAFT_1763069 [Baffinella frigidus]|nr:hypothetical protein T484DRAFT_1763069 [Cryptophyta sp. CCMP2293]
MALGEMYPEMCVFDLDACLWDKEMFEMSHVPTETVSGDLKGRGSGVVGAMITKPGTAGFAADYC